MATVIVAGARTPFGKFGIRAAVDRSGGQCDALIVSRQ
jgi:hypothetical protein